MKKFLLTILISAGLTPAFANLDIVWPVPNDGFLEAKPYEAYIQPHPHEDGIESGLFGCVRNNRTSLHKGIDIRATQFDRMEESLDPIHSILQGKIRYINRIPRLSNYGRYIVIEHTETSPSLLSVYSHLRSIPEDLKRGQIVRKGQFIGILGRSTSKRSIAKRNAYLHFEVGFQLSNQFAAWHKNLKPAPAVSNQHENWHPGNLIGLDFLELLTYLSKRENASVKDYLFSRPLATSIKVQTRNIPDFVRRHPELLAKPMSEGQVSGWQINFTGSGIPYAWKALSQDEISSLGPNNMKVVFHDEKVLGAYPCNNLVATNWKGEAIPGSWARHVIDLLLDIKNP
ncbi:MAG: M23 family metallopeptidase [Opitutaceae bacterium]|nr:M23 family metallopeptidase [Opitutaceae bacterium]